MKSPPGRVGHRAGTPANGRLGWPCYDGRHVSFTSGVRWWGLRGLPAGRFGAPPLASSSSETLPNTRVDRSCRWAPDRLLAGGLRRRPLHRSPPKCYDQDHEPDHDDPEQELVTVEPRARSNHPRLHDVSLRPGRRSERPGADATPERGTLGLTAARMSRMRSWSLSLTPTPVKMDRCYEQRGSWLPYRSSWRCQQRPPAPRLLSRSRSAS